MSDSTPIHTPPTPPDGNVKRKGGLSCLGMLAIVAGLFAVLLIIGGILVWQSISWFKNSAEPTISIGEPLGLTDDERNDVNRIVAQLESVKSNKQSFDETLSTRVLNGVIERILEDQALKETNENKPRELLALRTESLGNSTRIRMSVPAKDMDNKNILPGLYRNVEIDGELEIVDGVITQLEAQRVSMGRQDAPFLARRFIHTMTGEIKQASLNAKSNPQHNVNNPLNAFKLLRREGDRYHVVLDGSQLKD